MTSSAQFQAFDKTGIPWANIVAFVGHSFPEDQGLCKMIHDKGTCCIAGTSRNIDPMFIGRQDKNKTSLEKEYLKILNKGADVIETDLPIKVGTLLFKEKPTFRPQ